MEGGGEKMAIAYRASDGHVKSTQRIKVALYVGNS